MLTNDVLRRIERLVKLAPYLPLEMQQELHGIIRELQAAESREGTMPNSAIADLVEAVPDKLVREVVNDLRTFGRAQPGGFLSPEKKVPDEALRPDPPKEEPSYLRKEPGWQNPTPLGTGSVAQTAIFDEMVSALVGSQNDTSKLR
jgi:hypothetical protein